MVPEILLLSRGQSIKLLEPPLWHVVGWTRLTAKLPPSCLLTPALLPGGTGLGNRKKRIEKAHGLRYKQGDQLPITVTGKTDLGKMNFLPITINI